MEINTWKKTPGLMLYFNDWEMPRKILNAQNFKEFFDAVFNYAQSGEIPSPLSDGTVQIFFDSFVQKINADNTRYQNICRQRSEAAKKGHKLKQTNACNR